MGTWDSGIVDNDAAMDYLGALYRHSRTGDQDETHDAPTSRADVAARVSSEQVATTLRKAFSNYNGDVGGGAAETILAAIGLVAVTASGFDPKGEQEPTSVTHTLAETMGARSYDEYLGLLTTDHATELLPDAVNAWRTFTYQAPMWIDSWNSPSGIRTTLNALSQLLHHLTTTDASNNTDIPAVHVNAVVMAVDEPLEVRLGSHHVFVAYLAHGIIEYQLRGRWAQPVAFRDVLADGGDATRLPAKPYIGWQTEVTNWVRAHYSNTFTVR